jgi:hypothetical protein
MELEMCKFAETREELAKDLNDALDTLADGGMNGNESRVVARLREGIMGIVTRTEQIREILQRRASS